MWPNIKKEKLLLLRGQKLSNKETISFNNKLKHFGYMRLSQIIKNQNFYRRKLYKVFQMRFRPELINGKIDKECLKILNEINTLK